MGSTLLQHATLGKADHFGTYAPATGIAESAVTNLVADLAGKAQALARTAVKTANYTSVAGDLVPVDTTSGAVTVTLPNAPADKSMVCVKHIIQGGTNAVTIACAGSDVFNKTGGVTSGSLPYANQAMLLEYTATGGIWSVIADDLPLSALDLRFVPSATPFPLSETQPGTAGAPTATVVWQLNAPSGDTHGPMRMIVGGALFQSTFDRVMYLGYNANDQGGKVVTTEPKFSFQIESDYDDGAKRSIESYLEYARAAGRTVADGVTTNASPTVTSATAAFTSTNDVGRSITGAGIPANSYIGVVNSATSIGLSSSPTANTPVNATASASGVSLTITPSGPAQHRPIFLQVNRATGSVHFELNSTAGFSFNTTDGNGTNWGSLSPTGLTIAGLTGQSVSLVLTPASGQTASIQLQNGGTNAFALAPSTAGSGSWNFGIGASPIVMQLSTSQLDLSQGSGNGGFIAGKVGGYSIQNNAKNASLPVLRNIGTDQLFVGGTSWTNGIVFQAGGSQALQLTSTRSALVGSTAIATNSTDGFPYIPAAAGAPSGTPTSQAGFAPMYYDTTNHKLWVYDGGWKGTVLA